MSDFNGRYPGAVAQADTSVDAGLRAFMLGVYNKLALGLVVAGALAYVTGSVPEVTALMFRTVGGHAVGYTPLGMAVQWAPLVALLGSMFFMKNPTSRSASLLYWFVVAAMGASLGVIFLVYTGASIAQTFFITAASFGALSLWGYTTKRNLNGFGTFLFMGLIGLIIASVVNFFLRSAMLDFVVSAAGVLIFAGFTAYDTQKMKMTYYAVGGDKAALGPITSFAALNLFIDFLNLFLFLLRFLGNRR